MSFRPIKPFINYSQQISKLINDKRLIIHDSSSAKKALADISHYALIDSYKDIFYNRVNRRYLSSSKAASDSLSGGRLTGSI